MESVKERIDIYKKRCFRTYNYDIKASLYNLVYLLEHYTGEYDKDFHYTLESDKRYREIRDIKHERFANNIQRVLKKNDVLLENIIDPYKTSFVPSGPYKEQYIDPNTCLKIVGDFLSTINPYIYNLYCELYHDQRILFTERLDTGCEANAKSRDSIHVFCPSLCTVSDMSTLVHEMGHAYKDYRIPEHHRAFDVKDSIRCEMSSKTLELMFIMYLINNRIYYEDALKRFNWFENQVYDAANKYSRDKIINAFVAKQFAYLLGGIVANNYVFEPNMSYDDFIRKIYFSNIGTLIKDINKSNKVKKFHF